MKYTKNFKHNNYNFLKNNLLYSSNNSDFLGMIERGADFNYNRYELFKTKKGNYFVVFSYWRCKVDGSSDADRAKIFQDENDFKLWLSTKSIDAFKNIFDLSKVEVA